MKNRSKLFHGDCMDIIPRKKSNKIDAVVTDPPYGLKFMGKQWDHGVPSADVWVEVLRALKPGGYMAAMGGTRTYHRLACAVEDAGFEVRDCLMWIYGSGFPKGKGCLKPAWEPIILARKPGPKVLPLGIDECRVPGQPEATRFDPSKHSHDGWRMNATGAECAERAEAASGRYPANVVYDGSDEVLKAFAAFGDKGGGFGTENRAEGAGRYGVFSGATKGKEVGFGDSGSAARFFYCAKASKTERGEGNNHPTVKPLALMRWLVRLVCPPDGLVLDPFMGSGTTGVACIQSGRRFIGIEQDEKYFAIAEDRISKAAPKGGFFDL